MNNMSDTAWPYWPPFTALPASEGKPRIVRGRGVHLFAENGRRYIDGISGAYNHSLGHAHPGLIEAVTRQLEQLVHVCNINADTLLPRQLAERIAVNLLPAGRYRIFLATSGSEGVEAALKMAWMYQANKGRTARNAIVAIDGAYHGCTRGAMLATRRDFIIEGGPWATGGDERLTMPIPESPSDLEAWAALLEAKQQSIAAVIIEPVMGLEGTRRMPAGFLEDLSALVRRYDIPLICDEVFCGAGRAGAFCEAIAQGASPDIVIFSKSLGGGIPITAVAASDDIVASFAGQALPFFRHGHTQSGNLLGCGAALFVIDYLEANDLYSAILEKGAALLARLKTGLSACESVISLQGKGLMLSITFDSFSLCEGARIAARQHGVIVGTAGQYLKVAPAFTIEYSEIDELAQRLTQAITSLSTAEPSSSSGDLAPLASEPV